VASVVREAVSPTTSTFVSTPRARIAATNAARASSSQGDQHDDERRSSAERVADHRVGGEPKLMPNRRQNVECLIERAEASSEQELLDVLAGDQNVHQRLTAHKLATTPAASDRAPRGAPGSPRSHRWSDDSQCA